LPPVVGALGILASGVRARDGQRSNGPLGVSSVHVDLGARVIELGDLGLVAVDVTVDVELIDRRAELVNDNGLGTVVTSVVRLGNESNISAEGSVVADGAEIVGDGEAANAKRGLERGVQVEIARSNVPGEDNVDLLAALNARREGHHDLVVGLAVNAEGAVSEVVVTGGFDTTSASAARVAASIPPSAGLT